MATTKAPKTYVDVEYEEDCYIMFGKESAGIPEEILLEERILLENLHVTGCSYVDSTVLDTYTIQGDLPEQKESMLRAINNLLAFNWGKTTPTVIR